VLLSKVHGEALGRAKSVADMRQLMMAAPGAPEWLADCVAQLGADNVFVVSCVRSRKTRQLFEQFLFESGGLLQRVGINQQNHIWTDARDDKRWPSLQNALDVFIDDQLDVLLAIRMQCWQERRSNPPMLYLVPTVWHRGAATWTRTWNDATRANDGWDAPWTITPMTPVAAVCPWTGR